MIIIRQMDPSRATDREGSWTLRHVKMERDDLPGLDEDADVHAFLESARAPKDTPVCELIPQSVHLLGIESDELTVLASLLSELIRWPPS